MTRRTGAGNSGFTLIEVLIALSVLGVTMTVAFTLFSAGLKLRSVSQDRLAFDRDARLLMSAMKDDLANLVPSGPAPMVSMDSIVLWRLSKEFTTGTRKVSIPQLVTYQWSGSTFQDSLLVRVTTSLNVDANNFELVHQHFMKWARVFEMSDATINHLLREDQGARFGSKATLNGLSGSWRAYPQVNGFACGITENPTENDVEGSRSRILVMLSPEKYVNSIPGLDPISRLVLLPRGPRDIEAGFWLPIEAHTPTPSENGLPSEVLP